MVRRRHAGDAGYLDVWRLPLGDSLGAEWSKVVRRTHGRGVTVPTKPHPARFLADEDPATVLGSDEAFPA